MELTEAKQRRAQLNGSNDPDHLISLQLDEYDDIFSDFDPRPYSKRNISDDFLDELKKITAEKESDVEVLRLLLPHEKKDPRNVSIITARLKSHFKTNLEAHQADRVKIKRKAYVFLLIGIAMLVSASYVFSWKTASVFHRLIFVTLEPGGWFFAWSGLDSLMSSKKTELPELNFYRKISKVKIVFEGIES
jgi:hypothetical protein